MGPDFVVISTPSLQLLSSGGHAVKQFHVQAFIPQLPVEALDVPVLRSNCISPHARLLVISNTCRLHFTILAAGSARTYAANEKLNIAAIGIGGQGAGDIDQLKSQNIVALCDVDWRHAAGTFKKFLRREYRQGWTL